MATPIWTRTADPGLGARAHVEFAVPVIGVAKSAFRTVAHAIPVLRGTSARPLYVTAAGMPRSEVASLVQRMADRYRLPDELRRADYTACPRLHDADTPWPPTKAHLAACADIQPGRGSVGVYGSPGCPIGHDREC